jgi:hypothetical protein
MPAPFPVLDPFDPVEPPFDPVDPVEPPLVLPFDPLG